MNERFIDGVKAIGLAFLVTALAGCGGEEPVASNEPLPEPELEAAASPAQPKKKRSYSLMNKMDTALDKGDYKSAADMVLREKLSPAEQREHYQRLQQEMGNALARGDANAMEAAELLNKVRLGRRAAGQ